MNWKAYEIIWAAYDSYGENLQLDWREITQKHKRDAA